MNQLLPVIPLHMILNVLQNQGQVLRNKTFSPENLRLRLTSIEQYCSAGFYSQSTSKHLYCRKVYHLQSIFENMLLEKDVGPVKTSIQLLLFH